MKIHEYQGKEILKKYGVPVPRAIPAFSVEDAIKAAQALGGSVWVVKAQIHAGGRGKGGGVKVAKSMDEVKQYAEQILGMQLVTHQTGPAGQKVRRLLIEEGADIKKEYYLGMVIDRATQKVCVMASSEGGMNIEEVAEHTPELIHKLFVNPVTGVTDAEGDALATRMGMPTECVAQARATIQKLYQAFVETDADLAEINPLITTGDNRVVALDAKMNFDSNALYRHPEIVEMRDLDEEDPAEIEASKHDLAYISLDGNIGCLVNGAGLAMATMDTIKLYGGEPANFLDVGGGATTEKVTEAFKIMLKNPELKAILVNIFGGIMKCDVIAEGVIAAAKQVHLQVPLVVRMKGTNEELGKKMLAESGLPIISADTMAQAAERVVAAANGKPIPTGDGMERFAKSAAVTGAVAGAAGLAGAAAASTGAKHGGVTERMIDTVKDVTGDAIDFADDAIHTVKDVTGDAVGVVGDILEGTAEVVKGIAGGAANLAGGAVAGVAGVAGSVGDKLGEARETVIDTVKDVTGDAIDLAGDAIHTVKDVTGDAVSVVGDILEGTADVAKGIAGGAAGVVGGAGKAVVGAGAGAVGGVFGLMKRFWWLALPLILALWLLSRCTGSDTAVSQPEPTANVPAVSAPAITLKQDLIDAFKAKGASIALAGTQLTLAGEVESEAAKADLLNQVKTAYANQTVQINDSGLWVKNATASSGATKLNVEFGAGVSEVPASAYQSLNEFADYLKQNNIKGEIAGHSDSAGKEPSNVLLSDTRAKAVMIYLVQQGVPEANLSAKGYGSARAIASNDNEGGRARNRRVEFMPAQ